MQDFDFTDISFTLSESALYSLSLCCSADGLTALVRETSSGRCLVCRHYAFRSAGHQLLLRKIREIISGDELLHQPFGKTTIYLGEKQLVLIPEQLYSVKMAELLFPPVRKFDSGLEMISVPVRKPGAILAFRTGKEVYDYLTLTFPGAGFSHEVLPLLQQTDGQESVLRVHLHDSWFYAVSEEAGKVNFLNSFEFRGETDMLYFMLAVNREFNPENHPVILSGWIIPEDPRLALIRKYFPGMIWQGDSGPETGFVGNPAFRSYYSIFSK